MPRTHGWTDPASVCLLVFVSVGIIIFVEGSAVRMLVLVIGFTILRTAAVITKPSTEVIAGLATVSALATGATGKRVLTNTSA